MAEKNIRPATWGEVIRLSSEYLNKQNVPDSQVASELLAARLLKCGRGFLVSHLEKFVPEPYLEAMRRGMLRLIKGEPIQYVLGEWDFRTLTLKCDKRALIPRPETEDLVERVLDHLKRKYGGGATPFVVDVGTGS
ncbi:MAG: peptide chain release factor N(5)-glutamine methyltransferase, partial [Kiritimatiellae bacterium]|nr:peptide chain release factor N(5)-glutamine methyltransferase [Kiritimatiellia bacterium]